MKSNKNLLLLLITILSTMIAGGFIGDLLKDYLSIFQFNYPIKFFNVEENLWNIMDLNVFKLSFGMVININLGSILGVFLGLFIFYKNR
ncbi:DUF4321 domain-containing protein [Garciella nitratireducens]|uniref:DUF4321 domain-containing protein n=1 Tax=Garciella nitratireducens DSM 15102 TaxID=1121911 RepID=A0A1T4K9L9_9FIRM|nr:DUF4321 domain-containing protein [Garciella nitratireducens]RBP46717.1 uncharacterized protein DUF4321 [Garciella nitratireducens]SJZ39101.1 protein of unknown function [Garciella nitratireducens DSM 15102]